MSYHSYRAIIAYRGSPFYGFKQVDAGPTVQQELQRCLEKILGHPITIEGASLTDRGVHAEGQVIQFTTTRTTSALKLLGGMRALLPKSIAPLEVSAATETFHPSLDAKRKAYHYTICNLPSQLPFHSEFSWHIPLLLNLDHMEKAIPHLLGKRDFSAFSSQHYDDPFRHLMQISLCPQPEGRLRIEIEGDRFLYKMVRTLVGTLAWVGMGKISHPLVKQIVASCDRRRAGPTAPAHGLVLKRVYY